MRSLKWVFLLSATLFIFCGSSSEKGAVSENFRRKSINFESGGKTNQAILSIVKSTGKPGFLYFETDWCIDCKELKRDIFSRLELIEYVEKNFVPFLIDAEKETGPGLKTLYDIGFYPTVVFINLQGEIIDKIVGSDEFNLYFEKVSNIISRPEDTYRALKEKYELDPANENIAVKFALRLIDINQPKDAQPVLEKVLKFAKNHDNIAETFFQLGNIYSEENDENLVDKAVQYWERILNEYQGYEKLPGVYLNLGKTLFQKKLDKNKGIGIILKGIENGIFENDEDKAYFELARMTFEEKDYESVIKYGKRIPDNSRYKGLIDPLIGVCYYAVGRDDDGKIHFDNILENAGNDPTRIYRITSTAAANKVYLKEAETWMERAVNIDGGKSYYLLYNYARLLFENGKKEKAVEYQEKAVAAAPRERTKKRYTDVLEHYRSALGR